LCEKTARRDLRGGGRETGRPTSMPKENTLAMINKLLPYDPGVLPSAPSPSKGDSIQLEVAGLPPIKQKRISLRNPKNPRYQRFVDLREKATKAMKGKAWYFGAIRLDIEIFYKLKNEIEVPLVDYVGGIMDTLDGSSGLHFTYLPIVYEDDCQVCSGSSGIRQSGETFYKITIKFL